MGATKKAKIMFTCEHITKDRLTAWAKSENRTVSNLIETLVIEALNVKEEEQQGKNLKNKSQEEVAGQNDSNTNKT